MSHARRWLAAAVLLASGGSHGFARATGFTDVGDDLRQHPTSTVVAHGTLRLRGEGLYNLDLDRGPTPSGQLFFPVPLGDPKGQWLGHADMRLRLDLAGYALGGGVAVKVRIDAPDNVALGSDYVGAPSTSMTLRPSAPIRLKRAYGEALTPVGLLAAGRMGSHWGLGMLTNGGDCADCDSGDAADRVALVTPVLGHLVATSFDVSAIGPLVTRPNGVRTVDVEPRADSRTVTVAILNFRNDQARLRRRRAGKTTFEYGAYVAHRWQTTDVPATYLPAANPPTITPTQVMARGFQATALDGWLRLTHPRARIEAEAALLVANVEQPSLVPGVLLREPVRSLQIGAALESELGAPEDRLGGGLDVGYASGDPAFGFGVSQGIGARAPRAGDLDGPQASPPRDNRVDNFRFHPDYRVDRILWREILGTVTDAVYVRPHVRWRVLETQNATLTASLAGVASFASMIASTPGQRAPLGVELDPTLTYRSRDGLGVALEHAVLFPLAGLDNVPQNLPAKPAQLARVRLTYSF
ncbi:MAG: TIGR04551 family protein [Deltaproteobacteria bacterium]|nr:TIGR04551 family protein [Deltaproteobacteria bacterium]